jgi:3-deoxy-D-manno-octulosonic-acid transferase
MITVYRYLTLLLYPVFILLIYFRSISNKEHHLRFKEKIFSTSFRTNRNNKKKLFWFHVASIGELLSIFPLIEEINSSNRNIDFLITTTTLSSANLLKRKLNEFNNITHRFFPLDVLPLVKIFLREWKPDLICFVDSEIWPNFLFEIKKEKIPLVLINARITKKTFKRWNIFPTTAQKVFNNFDLCLACSEESKNILKKLHVKKLLYIGNLKFSVKIKKEERNNVLMKQLDNFKVWCAASTHKGEELIALKTHVEIKKKINNVLTIIIPRHINRVSHIKKLTNKFNLKSQVLVNKDEIEKDKEILIINSFGVLSQYFNCSKNIFIGKSLIQKLKKVAGQNPIEAAKHGCKIYYGPYVYNFQEVYDFLKINNIAEQIYNEKDLSQKIIENFNNPEKKSTKNFNLLNNYGESILKQTTAELYKLIRVENENI